MHSLNKPFSLGGILISCFLAAFLSIPSFVLGGTYGSNTYTSGVYNVGGDVTVPTASLTAPADAATLTGATVILSATASDNIAVAGVRFKVDGAGVGSEDTISPYSIAWDSTSVSNGPHTIVAVARDAANNYATSSAVIVTVSNTAAAPTVSTTRSSSGAPAGLITAIWDPRSNAIIPTVVANASAIPNGASMTVSNPVSTASAGQTTFGRDLKPSTTGDDVRTLQVFLNGHGFPVAPSGVGSSGNETKYFGAATKAALGKFQAHNGITPAEGYFGPKTKLFVSLTLQLEQLLAQIAVLTAGR